MPTFRGSNTRSGGLWSGGLDPKRGANRDQHSRDQRGRWFFKGWGIVMIPHRPNGNGAGNFGDRLPSTSPFLNPIPAPIGESFYIPVPVPNGDRGSQRGFGDFPSL
nr:hypothetical protein [Tanacetum cinerariifolium]